MQISFYQKVSLVDHPRHISAIAFVHGCPLRCPFCHNPQLVLPEYSHYMNKSSDFIEYLDKRKKMIEGVVFTGGEPLLQQNFESYLRLVKAKGLKIKVDTSGICPTQLNRLVKHNLVDYVALDFKNIENNLGATCGLESKNQIEEYYKKWCDTLKILRKSEVEYEIRTTVVKEFHALDTLISMSKVINENELWYIQPFEKKGSVLNDYNKQSDLILSEFSDDELAKLVSQLKLRHKNTYLRK